MAIFRLSTGPSSNKFNTTPFLSVCSSMPRPPAAEYSLHQSPSACSTAAAGPSTLPCAISDTSTNDVLPCRRIRHRLRVHLDLPNPQITLSTIMGPAPAIYSMPASSISRRWRGPSAPRRRPKRTPARPLALTKETLTAGSGGNAVLLARLGVCAEDQVDTAGSLKNETIRVRHRRRFF